MRLRAILPRSHWAGEDQRALASPPGFDIPTNTVQENDTYGGQGKAVGCVPPAALLFEQAVSIQDQQNQIRDQHDCRHARDGKH